METLTYIPSPRGEFLALARTPSGRLFKKQILSFGAFTHPSDPTRKLTIDLSVAQRLVDNFKNGVCDIVQVPIVDDVNRHVEDPLRNAGEVVDLTIEDDGVYAVIDARKHQDDFGKILLGASAMMHMDYTDVRSGEKVGPTLLHVAVTNRPYITNLKDFEEIVAASADNSRDEVVFLTPEEETEMPTFEELKATLKSEHDIDLDALQAAAENAPGPSADDLVAAMSNVLKDAGVITPAPEGDETVTVQDVAEAVIELSREKVALSSTLDQVLAERETERAAALEAEIDGYIEEGRILPKQRAGMLKLAREDRETFDTLLPEDSIVAMSAEGIDTHTAPVSQELERDIARLTALANGTPDTSTDA